MDNGVIDGKAVASAKGLTRRQLDRAAEFFMDVAKLLVASAVIGFFVPEATGGRIDAATFFGGAFLAILFFSIGIHLTPVRI